MDFLIQERVFALVFAALRIAADPRCFGHSAFATRYADLHSFAAKIFQTVENDREKWARVIGVIHCGAVADSADKTEVRLGTIGTVMTLMTKCGHW